uniref:Pentatricopeptide repeat-containing protein n=1 Tax=Oryza meridionalis TaxID=40149 RepID=A0A0E0DPP9_9ORYZ
MAVTAPSTPYRHMLETLHGLGRAFEARRIAGVREEPRLTWTRCGSNVVVDSAFVDLYLKCSSPEDALWVFAAVAARNITMWTTVMSGHSQHGRVAEALALFDQMMRVDRLRPNDVTFLTVLSACAHIELQWWRAGDADRRWQEVEELRVFGLTDDMIEDQKFAWTPSSSILLNRWR